MASNSPSSLSARGEWAACNMPAPKEAPCGNNYALVGASKLLVWGPGLGGGQRLGER